MATPAPSACPTCAAALPAAARYCGECGAAVRGGDATGQQHHVTVVVSDLQGSTSLAEGLDPESLRVVLDRYFDELGAVLESHGGRIEKRIGDMMVTVFGLPDAQPGDAARALRAAAETQQSLAALNEQLEARWGVRLANRTGVDTGAVVFADAGGGHRLLVGDALDGASALEPAAPTLEVLVSERTVAEVGEAASFGPPARWQTRAGEEVEARVLTAVADDGGPDVHASPDGACPSCRAPTTDAQKWCTACGVPLTRAGRGRDSRRTVTVVFADLTVSADEADEADGDPARGSADRHGTDEASEREALIRAFDVARRCLERHGGVVEKFIGDAVMAVFGLDARHEDDAARAARAALEMQDGLAALAPEIARDHGLSLSSRIGVNTGPVVAGDPAAGERLVTGDAVNVAARLEQVARKGAVVIGGLTRRLLGPGASVLQLEPLSLKGKAEPVEAYRLWSLGQVEATRRFELPMLGRDAEAERLLTAWEAVLSTRTWHRVEVRGEAGIGKSRLVHEFLDRLGPDAGVLRGACPPYGEGITFWPVAEIVRQAAGIEVGAGAAEAAAALRETCPSPDVADRLATLVGLDDRIVPVAELKWATRALLDHLAARAPLVVVVDGHQWAEPTLLELLDDLVAQGTGVPGLLLTMDRGSDEAAADDDDDDAADGPSPHEAAAAEPTRRTTIALPPLSELQCTELIDHALGEGVLPGPLRDRVAAASSGVPLYVEQLLTMLIDDGRLVRREQGWRLTVDVDDLAVPPTVEAILAARVDALDGRGRSALEGASVVGREFGRQAVEELTGLGDMSETLADLRHRQLVARSPRPGWLNDHRYRSQPARDVVYHGILKRDRSEMHRRFGDWLLERAHDARTGDLDELVGHHFEQAFTLGREVMSTDDALASTGRRAALHLGRAGERAFARGDMPAAANLLRRAADCVAEDEPEAARLLVLAGDASFEEGTFEDSAALYGRAEALAVDLGDEVLAAQARLALTTQTYLTTDDLHGAEVMEVAARAEATFAGHGAHGGIARCWRLRSYIEVTHCQWGAAERAAVATIDAARLAGDRALELRLLPALAGFSLYGPTPVGEALDHCREILDAVGDDRRARALVERSTAHLMALAGRAEEGARLCAGTRSALIELGWNFDAALLSMDLGPILMMAGRAADAEAELRRDHGTLAAMGEQNYIALVTCLLAEAVRQQGRLAEAADLAGEAEAMTAEDDVGAQCGWRAVRARVLCAVGDHETALSLAEEALALQMDSDEPAARAEALLDRGLARLGLGDPRRASQDAAAALDLYTAKGHRPGMVRASAVLTDAGGASGR